MHTLADVDTRPIDARAARKHKTKLQADLPVERPLDLQSLDW